MGVRSADKPPRLRRLSAVGFATLAAALLAAAPGSAQVVTIGTPTANFGTGMSLSSCSSCTEFQAAAPGYQLVAPVDGTITTWRVAGRGPLALRVLRVSGGVLIAEASSPVQAFVSDSVATFPVSIPVLAGDQIGVDLRPATTVAQVRFAPLATAAFHQDQPAVADGAQVKGESSVNGAISLNADVAITPVATGVDVKSGSTAGGTAVTISGSYLDGVTSVQFGGGPAAFTPGGAGQLFIQTPPHAAGPVDLVVRGPGGASTLAAAFSYLTPVLASGSIAPGAPGTLGGPVISAFKLTPTSFRAAVSGGSSKQGGAGTRLTYGLSVAATTYFAIQRIVPGRLVPARGGVLRYCQAALLPVPRPARCTHTVALSPGLSQRGGLGPNSLHFDGRVGGRTLALGSYRFTATAIDALGRRSAAVIHAFRILAPPARSCPQAHGSAAAKHC